MILDLLDLTQTLPPLTRVEVYQSLINALDLRSGFGILFVQCSPAEADRLIPQLQRDLPEKNMAALDLTAPINDFYTLVTQRPDKASLNVLFVRGLEKSLEDDVKPGYGGLGDYYNLNTVPPILNHLNQQRENFRDHFPHICFVFILPRFGIRYFVRRAPDFYDWNSGIFEIPDKYHSQSLSLELRYHKAFFLSDRAVNPSDYEYMSWYNRGYNLDELGRYEEAIAAYDRSIRIKPDLHEAWCNRGNALFELGRYKEAIASYDSAIAIKSDDFESVYNKGIACLK